MSAASKLPGADCAHCPGRDRPLVPPLPAQPIGTRPRLAIVGEGPGRNEVEQRQPFVGASGRMLMRGLRAIGLARHECHWTNAVPCDVRPRDLPEARKRCAKRLQLELAAADPPVVMPVGALGTRSALMSTRPTPILKWRGSVSRVNYSPAEPAEVKASNRKEDPGATLMPAVEGALVGSSPTPGAWVLPTIHPAFVMRARQWGPVLETDVERVGRIMREGFTAPEDQPGRRLLIARTMQELEEGLHAMSRCDDSGFDVETVGLGPTHTALVCFGLSDGVTTLVVPWSSKRDGSVPWWPRARKVSGAVSEFWRARRVITQNGPSFDHIVARRYGLEISAWDDTLIAAHATHPELPKNLAHIVTMGLDVPPWKTLEDRTADLPRLWTYNGRDTLYTILRWAQMRSEVT